MTGDGTVGDGTAGDDWRAVRLAAGGRPGRRVARAPDCGATVVFTGVARDHSEGRVGVELLSYEAYEAQAVRRMAAVAGRGSVPAGPRPPGWRSCTGWARSPLGEAAVVVGVGAGHRGEAFDAAHYCIDAVKATVPIWKRERWRGGEEWGLGGATASSRPLESARRGCPPIARPLRECTCLPVADRGGQRPRHAGAVGPKSPSPLAGRVHRRVQRQAARPVGRGAARSRTARSDRRGS